MKNTDIPSVFNAHKWFYRLHNSSDRLDTWRCHETPITDYLGICETLGDGMTQHAPERLVFMENYVDAMFSVANAVCADPDNEAFESLGWHMGLHAMSTSEVKFFLSLKYRESKRQYYSQQLEKAGTSEKLQYDKRYELLPEWVDGTPAMAYDLCMRNSYLGFTGSYQRYNQFYEVSGSWFSVPKRIVEQLRGLDEDECKRAYDLIKIAVAAVESREQLKNFSKRWTEHLIETRKEKEAAITQEPAMATS